MFKSKENDRADQINIWVMPKFNVLKHLKSDTYVLYFNVKLLCRMQEMKFLKRKKMRRFAN